MGIGGSIVVAALGLVLALAVPGKVGAIDVEMIGWILTGAGVLGLIISLILTASGRCSDVVAEETVVRDSRVL